MLKSARHIRIELLKKSSYNSNKDVETATKDLLRGPILAMLVHLHARKAVSGGLHKAQNVIGSAGAGRDLTFHLKDRVSMA